MSINIGKEIQRLLDEKRMSVETFARKLGMQSRSIYSIFDKQYIHTKLLKEISSVLEINLFLHYVNKEDLPSNPELQSRINKLEEEAFRKDKEITYLKEINQLLREK